MTRPCQRRARVESVIDAVGRGAAWLNLGMVAVTCVVVVLRYAFDTGAIFLQESVVYLHGAALLTGLSYALRHDAHVRVDVLYSRLAPRARSWVNVLGHALFLAPLAAAVVVLSWGYVADSWAVLEGSQEVGGVPAVFLLKTLMPLAAFLLLLQAGALVARGIRELSSSVGKDAAPTPAETPRSGQARG